MVKEAKGYWHYLHYQGNQKPDSVDAVAITLIPENEDDEEGELFKRFFACAMAMELTSLASHQQSNSACYVYIIFHRLQVRIYYDITIRVQIIVFNDQLGSTPSLSLHTFS